MSQRGWTWPAWRERQRTEKDKTRALKNFYKSLLRDFEQRCTTGGVGDALGVLGVVVEKGEYQTLDVLQTEVLEKILTDGRRFCIDSVFASSKEARFAFAAAANLAFSIVRDSLECNEAAVRVYLRYWRMYVNLLVQKWSETPVLRLFNLMTGTHATYFFSHSDKGVRREMLLAWSDFGAHWLTAGGAANGINAKALALLNNPFTRGKYPALKTLPDEAVLAWVKVFSVLSSARGGPDLLQELRSEGWAGTLELVAKSLWTTTSGMDEGTLAALVALNAAVGSSALNSPITAAQNRRLNGGLGATSSAASGLGRPAAPSAGARTAPQPESPAAKLPAKIDDLVRPREMEKEKEEDGERGLEDGVAAKSVAFALPPHSQLNDLEVEQTATQADGGKRASLGGPLASADGAAGRSLRSGRRDLGALWEEEAAARRLRGDDPVEADGCRGGRAVGRRRVEQIRRPDLARISTERWSQDQPWIAFSGKGRLVVYVQLALLSPVDLTPARSSTAGSQAAFPALR